MNLPDGISYHPMQGVLMSTSQPAWIRIDADTVASAKDYRINPRTFQSIEPFLHEDWRVLAVPAAGNDSVVYSGAEHRGSVKLPNVTIVPNFEQSGAGRCIVLGSTMGHWHGESASEHPVQEVYEFQSYGLIVLDRENGRPELWVAGPGDKVTVPGECHMTLYNLGDRDQPLVTLDFAHPDRNRSAKDLVSRVGPILFASYDDAEAAFLLSRRYINDATHRAGVRLPDGSTDERRRVVIPLRGRLDLGAHLYSELTGNPDVIAAFARLGLGIRKASPDAFLPSRASDPGRRPLFFSGSLVDVTRVVGHHGNPQTLSYPEVYRYFFPAVPSAPATPGESRGRGIAQITAERATEKQARLDLPPLNRPLIAVVEGAGQWVERTYRKIFDRAMADGVGHGLSVFYTDDGTWRTRPDWAGEARLQHWETYLDKTDPRDAAIRQGLRPDVVFVVTPDFTHSRIARDWLGKSPLVFVEKPFDSRIANVDDLLRASAQRRGTEVLGLDHWLSDALPLHELKAPVVDHLGGALASMTFFMTEDRPIERGRDRSLQFGLMLDLTPHMLALLTHFGDVSTIDDIRVCFAGQYRDLIAKDPDTGAEERIPGFRNETACALRFTFQDYSGNGFRIPCRAVVGKGFKRAVRYLEVTGRNGKSIRLDLHKKPREGSFPDYPWYSLFFMDAPGATAPLLVKDPYDPARTLAIVRDRERESRIPHDIDEARYRRLLWQLIQGRAGAASGETGGVASALLLKEARAIVQVLDRFWLAVQAARPWQEYPLGVLDPMAIPGCAATVAASLEEQNR